MNEYSIKKNLKKHLKGLVYFIIFVNIIVFLYCSNYYRNLIVNNVKSIFQRKSSLPPTESIPLVNDIIKYVVKLSNEKINAFYNQTETFIVDNTKSVFNFTYGVISSSSPVIIDKTSQIINAINSTLFSTVPILKDQSSKVQTVVIVLLQ